MSWDNVRRWEGWLAPLLPEHGGDIAIDVGANVGTYTVDMAQIFNQVHVFEPHPGAMIELTERTVQFPNIVRWSYAVGEDAGTVEFHLFEDHAHTSAHLENFDASRSAHTGNTLKALRLGLDDIAFQGSVDFIKVDTEGGEVEVLKGATDVVEIHSPQWLIEYHSQLNYEVCSELLCDMGYEVVTHIPHPHPGVKGHGWMGAKKDA